MLHIRRVDGGAIDTEDQHILQEIGTQTVGFLKDKTNLSAKKENKPRDERQSREIEIELGQGGCRHAQQFGLVEQHKYLPNAAALISSKLRFYLDAGGAAGLTLCLAGRQAGLCVHPAGHAGVHQKMCQRFDSEERR